jgi:hypothetical protein
VPREQLEPEPLGRQPLAGVEKQQRNPRIWLHQPGADFGLDNAAGLAEIVARHSQVERILCGHLHRTIDRRFAGTVAGTAPSTAHQIGLNLVADARISFIFEPPGYQLHLWQQDSGLVTHTAVLSVRFDPEELREEIRAYQDTVSGVVARYDGFVAKYMGDGKMVCGPRTR